MSDSHLQGPSEDSPDKEQDGSELKHSVTAFKNKKKSLFGGIRRVSENDVTIAVDIGYQDITLLKMAKTLGHKSKIIDYSRIPFDSLIAPNTPTFSSLLKKHLVDFCGSHKGKAPVWTFISSSEVEVRRFLIPDVPKKIVSKTVFLALKRELVFNDKEYIFDYSLQEKVKEGRIEKQAVLACVARKSSVNDLSEQFSKIGFPLAGITLFPLGVQNLFKQGWLADDKASCDLCIGKARSRIDIYLHSSLVITRDIKTGIDSMVDQIVEDAFSLDLDISADLLGLGSDGSSGETKDIKLSIDNITRAESEAKGNEDQARDLLFSLCRNDEETPDADPPVTASDKTEETADVINLIDPVLSRLIRQTDSTIKYYIDTISREGIGRIYISGALAESRQIVDYFGRELSVECHSLESIIINNAAKSCEIDEGVLVPGFNYHAAGLALSDYETDINFLYTYEEKDERARRLKINRGIFLGYLILSLALLAAFVWQNMLISQKRDELKNLQVTHSQYSPYPEQILVSQLAEKAIRIKKQDKQYAQKYISMAVLNELIELTPSKVKLRSISMVIGRPVKAVAGDEQGRGKATQQQEERRIINLEGVVRGRRDSLEAMLASYIVKLSGSPMFGQPDIVNSFIENDNGADSLLFTLNMKIK